MHSATIDATTRINYMTYHDDKKPTIILIHGFTGSHKGFQYLEPLLKDCRLIVPDLPGFGESDLHDEKDWNIDGTARIMNDFVAQIGFEHPPTILGHSMGGLVVSSMVAQKPELYDDVVLISPVPTAIRRNDARAAGAVLGALQYRIGAMTGKVGDKLVKSRVISRLATQLMTKTSDRDRRRAIVQHHYDNLDFISSIHFYEKLYHDINRRGAIDYADALSRKRLLLIAGDHDTVTPLKEIKKLQEAIQPEKFVIINGIGHLIHYEKPEEAASEIRAFLN